jgi:hypothetical protein
LHRFVRFNFDVVSKLAGTGSKPSISQ